RISGRLKSSRFPWSAMSGSPARPRPRGSRAPALVLVGGGGQVLDVCRRGGEISSDGDRVGEQEEEHERNSLGQSRRRDGEHVERGNEGAVPDDEDGRRAHDEERQEAREGSAPQHLRRAGKEEREDRLAGGPPARGAAPLAREKKPRELRRLQL